MKTKTAELTGSALDWAVAKCEGYTCHFDDQDSGPWLIPAEPYMFDEMPLSRLRPSTDWSQGGPIIERENMTFMFDADDRTFTAHVSQFRQRGMSNRTRWQQGPTHLIAAMRTYVASRLGDEIDIPEELR